VKVEDELEGSGLCPKARFCNSEIEHSGHNAVFHSPKICEHN
jgi:hypothetical protein